jgi:hypothetical protein
MKQNADETVAAMRCSAIGEAAWRAPANAGEPSRAAIYAITRRAYAGFRPGLSCLLGHHLTYTADATPVRRRDVNETQPDVNRARVPGALPVRTKALPARSAPPARSAGGVKTAAHALR